MSHSLWYQWPMSTFLKSQQNGRSDRSFFSYCDAHPIVKDYQERKRGDLVLCIDCWFDFEIVAIAVKSRCRWKWACRGEVKNIWIISYKKWIIHNKIILHLENRQGEFSFHADKVDLVCSAFAELGAIQFCTCRVDDLLLSSGNAAMRDLWRDIALSYTTEIFRDIDVLTPVCDYFATADWGVFVLALNSVYVVTLFCLGPRITEGESNSPCKVLLRLQPTRTACVWSAWSLCWSHWAHAGLLNEKWVV